MSSWIRQARQEMTRQKSGSKRRNDSSTSGEEKVSRVDSLITSIDGELLATAALGCKAYARALMTVEGLIVAQQERNATEEQLQPYYDRLHSIYASLEEPDGMEGVSAKMTSPSLDHRIREHESTGRWTSAQSCWELKLQQAPDDLGIHIGFIRCLKNLGHHGMPDPIDKQCFSGSDHSSRHAINTHQRHYHTASGLGSPIIGPARRKCG